MNLPTRLDRLDRLDQRGRRLMLAAVHGGVSALSPYLSRSRNRNQPIQPRRPDHARAAARRQSLDGVP